MLRKIKCNSMKNFKLTTLLIVLCTTHVFSQKKTFNTNSGLCYFSGEYDSTKYTKEQLQNTVDYLAHTQSFASATVWEYSKIPSLDYTLLKNEYDQFLNKIISKEFPDHPYWNRLRLNILKYYKQELILKELTIKAYKKPKVLLDYKLIDKQCEFYRDAIIAGGEKLLKAWEHLHKLQLEERYDKKEYDAKFQKKYKSKKRMEYALVEVMSFGWWNHANHLLPRKLIEHHFEERFKNLFIKSKWECDEP